MNIYSYNTLDVVDKEEYAAYQKKVHQDVAGLIRDTMTDVELLPVWRAKIRELNALIKDEKQFIHKRCQELAQADDYMRWYLDWSIEGAERRIKGYEAGRRRFQWNVLHLQAIKKGNQQPGPPPVSLEEIKAIPLSDFFPIQNKTMKSPNREMFCCPLPNHDDSSPSFVWYKLTNTFYCFGCKAGGSNIDFVMKMNDISFSEAIKLIISAGGLR